jgi:hypothetical protein
VKEFKNKQPSFESPKKARVGLLLGLGVLCKKEEKTKVKKKRKMIRCKGRRVNLTCYHKARKEVIILFTLVTD